MSTLTKEWSKSWASCKILATGFPVVNCNASAGFVSLCGSGTPSCALASGPGQLSYSRSPGSGSHIPLFDRAVRHISHGQQDMQDIGTACRTQWAESKPRVVPSPSTYVQSTRQAFTVFLSTATLTKRLIMGFFSSSSTPGVTGANDIPAPRSDASRNAPPDEQHQRVIDFIKVSVCGVQEARVVSAYKLGAWYSWRSRVKGGGF